MKTPVQCTICLGSNYGPDVNINKARISLKQHFPDIVFGHPVITPSEGDTTAPDYTNQAARFTSTLSIPEIKLIFKDIEAECGRTPQSKSTGLIPLDIDLLIYGSTIVKPRDLNTSYVQKALSSI